MEDLGCSPLAGLLILGALAMLMPLFVLIIMQSVTRIERIARRFEGLHFPPPPPPPQPIQKQAAPKKKKPAKTSYRTPILILIAFILLAFIALLISQDDEARKVFQAVARKIGGSP